MIYFYSQIYFIQQNNFFLLITFQFVGYFEIVLIIIFSFYSLNSKDCIYACKWYVDRDSAIVTCLSIGMWKGHINRNYHLIFIIIRSILRVSIFIPTEKRLISLPSVNQQENSLYELSCARPRLRNCVF